VTGPLLDDLDDETLDLLAALLAPRLEALAKCNRDCGHSGLLTCSEAARRTGTHVETIRRAVRSGALPAGKVGRSPRIAPADLDAWLSAGNERPAQRAPRPRRPRTGRRPLADAMAALTSEKTKRPRTVDAAGGMAQIGGRSE
jgi:excisionase family DNA binding protein